MQIKGSTILITGASSGIGAACAAAAARAGARVVLLARTQPALEQLAAQIHATGGSDTARAREGHLRADQRNIRQ